MVRVLQVISGMNAGGMETMIMNYYRKMDRNKIQFDFLINTSEKCFYEDEIKSLGGKIYRVTARRKNVIKNRKELRNFFNNHKYLIAEFHQGITYYYPLKMAKKYGVKVRIIHNHGIDRKFLKYLKIYNEVFAKRRISNLATHYFSCSEEVNNQLFSNRTLKKRKIEIVSNAIDSKMYEYDEENRKVIRKELNLDENIKIYGHIGTFTYPKNHQFLINLFVDILKKNKNSRLILIGKGPLENEIRNLVKEKRIDDKVIFLGIRNDIYKVLSAMDYFLFPSLFEGIPLTLIEAQANGISIIMSDRINKKTIINDNCLSIPLEEKEEWVNALANMKKENAEERKKRNQKVKETNFDIDNVVKKLQGIYLGYAKEKIK